MLLLALHASDGSTIAAGQLQATFGDRESCMVAWQWMQAEKVHAQCVQDRK